MSDAEQTYWKKAEKASAKYHREKAEHGKHDFMFALWHWIALTYALPTYDFLVDAKKKQDSTEEKKLDQLQTLGKRPHGTVAKYVER